MSDRNTAHRVAGRLRRQARLLVAFSLYTVATILFPVFAWRLLPVATAPRLEAASLLAKQATCFEVFGGLMLLYWMWLYAEALRLVRPVLMARLKRRERRLFTLALTLLFVVTVASLSGSPAALESARTLLALDLLTIALAIRIHLSRLNDIPDALRRLGQWAYPRLTASVQSAVQTIFRNRVAALVVAGSKLWVEIGEFLKSPSLARAVLVLLGVLLLLALLLRPPIPPSKEMFD